MRILLLFSTAQRSVKMRPMTWWREVVSVVAVRMRDIRAGPADRLNSSSIHKQRWQHSPPSTWTQLNISYARLWTLKTTGNCHSVLIARRTDGQSDGCWHAVYRCRPHVAFEPIFPLAAPRGGSAGPAANHDCSAGKTIILAAAGDEIEVLS